MTEVYEVATFYHHFDVVKEGEDAAAAAHRARLRDAVVPDGGRRRAARGARRVCGARRARASARRASAAASTRRPRSSGAITIDHATADRRSRDAVRTRRVEAAPTDYIDLRRVPRRAAAIATLRDCVERQAHARGGHRRRWKAPRCAAWAAPAFPTGRKWKIVRAEPAPRLMAVNIDEGEPGTFKDRYYLERDPHRFLEGMLIAAWAVGIDAHLRLSARRIRGVPRDPRARARGARPPIRRARCRAIHLRRGAGAYICGEESAMIESIEGKRGMPRLRPPYVAQVGLFGRPTLEHNMETLYWVRDILEKGAAWFAGQGRNGRKGLRSFSVSGRVKKPGVHLAPAGITVRELIDEYCGGMLDGPRRSTATCRAARRAASCRRRWATSRSTSTRCSRTAASSARRR